MLNLKFVGLGEDNKRGEKRKDMNDELSIGGWLKINVWNPVAKAAAIAVGSEESPDLPPLVPPMLGCAADSAQNQGRDTIEVVFVEVVEKDGKVEIQKPADAVDSSDGLAGDQGSIEPLDIPDPALETCDSAEGQKIEVVFEVCLDGEGIPDIPDSAETIPEVSDNGFEEEKSSDAWEGKDAGDGYLDQEAEAGCDEKDVCTTYYYYCDKDGDGYYNQDLDASCSTFNCIPPGCQLVPGEDCNDANLLIYPGAAEICGDDIDENCDGVDFVKAGGKISNIAYSWDPVISFHGTFYAVYYDDGEGIYLNLVDLAGNKLGAGEKNIRDPWACCWAYDVSVSGNVVVWVDGRETPPPPEMLFRYEVFSTRTDENGNKLGVDVKISDDDLAWSGEPAVACNPLGWCGVVWQDKRDGEEELYASLLNPDGEKASEDLRLTNALGFSRYPDITLNETGYTIVWTDERDGNAEIYVMLVDSSGQKITEDIRLTEALGFSGYPDIMADGTGYAVAWRDERDGNAEVYLMLLDPGGGKLTQDLRLTTDPATSISPSLAGSASGYAIAWSDNREGEYEVYFMFTDLLGGKLTEDLRLSDLPETSSSPNFFYNGFEHAMVWTDYMTGKAQTFFANIDCQP